MVERGELIEVVSVRIKIVNNENTQVSRQWLVGAHCDAGWLLLTSGWLAIMNLVLGDGPNKSFILYGVFFRTITI